MTEHYLIILKCEIDVKALSCNLINNSRIIIHMAPFNCLKVKKSPRKRLEILFPNKCTCFFKLMSFHGCGSAWKEWKRLKDICSMDDHLHIPSHWALIPFGSLVKEVQNFLKKELFLRPIRIKMDHLKVDRKERFDTDPEVFQKVENNSDGTESSTGDVPKRREDMQDDRRTRTSRDSGRRSSHRKIRQVNRFGEGIHDGCDFDLYLSFSSSDDTSFEDVAQLLDPKTNTTKDNNHLQSKQDKRIETFSGNLIAQKMALEYVHQLEADVEAENRKEKTLNRIAIPTSSDEAVLKNAKSGEVSLTLKMASRFLCASPFFASIGIMKSQSVDSLTQVGSVDFEYRYLMTNLSLPNLDDLAFHRRNNRLSYSAAFVDERAEQNIPISFWISHHDRGGFCRKRVYSVNPVSQKCEVIRRSTIIRKLRKKENEDTEKESWSCSSTDDFTKEVLKEIKNEYPIRHSLWTASPDPEGKTKDENSPKNEEKNENPKYSPEKDWHGNISKRLKDVNPFQLAQELREIQLVLFCQIEDGEIARWMLKPKSVTEVNCPYLCGYLHFSERIENIVVSETLVELNDSEISEVICYFIQVAHYCFKNKDRQSSYAILRGLCRPEVMISTSAWTVVHQHHRNELKIFQKLFNACWKETNTYSTDSNIPVFKSLVDTLYDTVAQRKNASSTNTIFRKLLVRFKRWFDDKNKLEISFVNHIFCHLLIAKTIQEELVSRKIHHFEELLTSSYGHLEEVITTIEECRQNYCFRLRSAPFQDGVRDLVLSKQYKCIHCKNLNNK